MGKNSNLKMIRVLHCIHSLVGGGAEKQLKLLASVSLSSGFVSGIFCVNENGNDIVDVSVKIYKSSKSNKFNFSIFSSLEKAIKDFKPDLIHAWLPEVVTIPAMILAFVSGVPCVYSYRNKMCFHRPLTMLEFIFSVGLTARIVSNNSVVQSNFLYRWLFKLKNGVEIANAVQVDPRFRKGKHGQNNKKTYRMLSVGRLTKQKNLKCLLLALPFVEQCYNWELSICGEGEEHLRLLEIINELQLGDKVRLLGYRSDVYALMQQSDLLILPSFFEGMPNVLLEALAIGLPCIVSDIPAHQNILERYDCALTFDPESPRLLGKIINLFFSDENAGRRIQTVGWRAIEEFTCKKMADRYYYFYAEILGKCQKKNRNINS